MLPGSMARIRQSRPESGLGFQADRLRVGSGRVPREQKMLKGHLPRVIYHLALLEARPDRVETEGHNAPRQRHLRVALEEIHLPCRKLRFKIHRGRAKYKLMDTPVLIEDAPPDVTQTERHNAPRQRHLRVALEQVHLDVIQEIVQLKCIRASKWASVHD